MRDPLRLLKRIKLHLQDDWRELRTKGMEGDIERANNWAALSIICRLISDYESGSGITSSSSSPVGISSEGASSGKTSASITSVVEGS